MKLLLFCLFCAYRGGWSEQTEPTSESITAAGGKIEELVTAEPLNVEHILKGIVEVDAKPKTKVAIVKKGPALFKELADAKILPIAVGEPNGKAGESVTASVTLEEVVTSKPLNLEQILKGILEVDAKPKTKESEAKKRPNLFKELAEKYARYFTKDKKKRPEVQILPMPIAVGEPNGGQKSVDFSLDGYFYQGDKKIATYRIDFKGVHFKRGALRAERPSELVDPLPNKGADKDNDNELVDPRPDKDGDIEIDEVVDPRPEKPVENKDDDKVDPAGTTEVQKLITAAVDPAGTIEAEGTTTTAEKLITAADPAGTTEAQKPTSLNEHEVFVTRAPVRKSTELDYIGDADEFDPKAATIKSAGKTTEAKKQVTVDGATIEAAGTTTEAEKLITPEVDPVPTKGKAETTASDVTIAADKSTAHVEVTATPLEEKEAVVSTTGAGPIDSGIQKSTEAVTPHVDEAETESGETTTAGIQKSTEAAKEEESDHPAYTGAPPKYEFGPGKCTIMYEFYFDERAKRCIAKRFWVCNEEDWKKVSHEKTFAACMKTAPKIMPADNNERTPCPLGKVWSRVPGEPSAYLYLKKCDDHSCPTEGSCVLDGTSAHCCVMPNHKNNMK